MPDLWMPGAERADVGNHAPTDQQYPARAIAHITWDRNATAAKPADLVSYASLKSYFSGSGRGVAPHILWDPFEGRFAQFFPADSRSMSLVDASGGTRTNRAGKVVLQIEALFFPYCRYGGKVYASLAETPCKGWAQLNAWVRSWGVLDTWPMGRPVSFASHRDERTWETRGGWYAHSQVPENDHQDPGSWPAFVNAPVASKPEYAPFPGAGFFHVGRKSALITAMGRRLVAKGCGQYEKGPGPEWTEADRKSYAAWQHKLGYSGSAADGIPGKASWDKLQVPNV
ncbi:peptidoglycan-binding protein [Streptomyces misionensis]|uniref:peptidoglycan-binding protein n=1 Tax=Streptomyces misionensis TaxID=67331 RepID=UPI0036C1C755